MRLYFLLASLALCVTISHPVKAQDVSQCNPALYKSTEYVRDNEAARLSWAYTMNRTAFDEVKHDVQSGITVPIKGIPVSGNLDCDDFHRSAERDFTESNSDYSFDRARSYLKSYLSSESGSAYANCLDAVTRSLIGVHAWVTYKTGKSVLVKIRWVPSGQPKEETIHLQIKEATDNPAIQDKWLGVQEHDYSFDKSSERDFELLVNLGDFGDKVVVPLPPRVPERREAAIFPQVSRTYTTVTANQLVCSETRVPAGVTVRISLAGSWSESPYVAGHQNVGPLGYPPPDGAWKSSVVLRASDSKQILSKQVYAHPNFMTAQTDYDVCVELPPVSGGHNLIITAGDPLILTFEDSRINH